MRRWLKWIGIAALVPVSLVSLLAVLLYIPSFQDFAVREAAAYASRATGMRIGIQRLRLSFPLALSVRGIEVVGASADTLLSLGDLTVRVQARPLFRRQVLVEAVDLRDVRLDTGSSLEGMTLRGTLGRLYAKADYIDLANERATLNEIDLSDTAITLLLDDTTARADTGASVPVNWALLLEKIRLRDVAFALQMPSDSLRLTAFIERAGLERGFVDLGEALYKVRSFRVENSSLAYDANFAAPAAGLDPAHIRLSAFHTAIDSIFYQGRNINARVCGLSAEERSGLTLTALEGDVRADTARIHLPELRLRTGHSDARLAASIPWSALEEPSAGEMTASLDASIGKGDLMLVAGALPADFRAAYPDRPLQLRAGLRGNLSAMSLSRCDVTLPGALRLGLTGAVESVADSVRRTGEVRLDAEGGDLSFLLAMLPAAQRERFAIPTGLRLTGEASLAQQAYHADLSLEDDTGRIDLTAFFDPTRLAYKASLRVDSLAPTRFLPRDSLFWLAASLDAEGEGTDPFANDTRARLTGKITDIYYGSASVSDVTVAGALEEHLLKLDLLSAYPLAEMDLSLNATLHANDVKAMLIADVENLDLRGLRLTPDTLATSFQLFAEAASDMDENNTLDVTLGNWELATSRGRFHPKTLILHAHTDADTTRVSFHAGDLGIVLTGNDCVHHLADHFTRVSSEIASQLERDSTVNLESLRPLLPELSLNVKAGKDNPIYNFLQAYYTEFESLALNAYTSPATGVRMDASLFDLARDTLLVDTIQARVYQDSLGLLYDARVVKNPYRKQMPFDARLDGQIRRGYVDARLSLRDGEGRTGLLLGVRADKVPDGIRFHLFPDEPVIAFQPFRLNPDNYVTYRSVKDIGADLRLTGKGGASLWIHSLEERAGMEEVHVELGHIDLGVLSEALSYLPAMEGILSADLQYAPSDTSFLVAADLNIDDLYYENERVGELLLNAIYLPLSQGSHQADAHLFRDGEEISAITALYQGASDEVTGDIDFLRFPLDMANPFIPDDMARMAGYLEGRLSVGGTSGRPKVDGSLRLDTASVYIGAVGSSFRFDDKRIQIQENRVLFDRYGIYAADQTPFLIDGEVDFSNLSRMTADLSLTADNVQLLNAKRTPESLVYGKLFVGLNSTVRGPLDALTMRGDLRLLGGTNITYVLKDSPLTVQDRMSGLVTFTSFADTVKRRMPRKPPLPMGGMDMLMTIRIDPAVQANVDLSSDQSNHVNLEGGGDLSFQYTPQGDMFLNGRYTLSGGTIKYSIPVIPLKEFNVAEGSFVQWTGDPMDPTLNLVATERVRTSVTPAGQSSPRLVNFDVGIELTQRLENLGLQFTLEAPEDLAMQEELTAKGAEERAKLAVSMLVTGMYLGGGSGGKVNLDMGDALTSFLQGEINNIAGNALKTVDISFGMETYDDNSDAGGGTRTDYSFRFAKRFYNDRIRVVLGGRISTGENINNGQAQPFIDNVSVEYRLDNSGSRYVKLFHNKNYESLLEGEITETGAGVVLRRKMMRLRELFNFKKMRVKPINEEEE